MPAEGEGIGSSTLIYNTKIGNADARESVDMALYQSEVTMFLNRLKEERPQLDAEQRKGRAIWWDAEPLDPGRQLRDSESRVPQKAYPYQTQG